MIYVHFATEKRFWNPCMGSNGFARVTRRRQRRRKVKRNVFGWFLVCTTLSFFISSIRSKSSWTEENLRWMRVMRRRWPNEEEKNRKEKSSRRRHILSTRFTDLLCHLLLRINGQTPNGRHQLFRGSPNANHSHRNFWRFFVTSINFPFVFDSIGTHIILPLPTPTPTPSLLLCGYALFRRLFAIFFASFLIFQLAYCSTIFIKNWKTEKNFCSMHEFIIKLHGIIGKHVVENWNHHTQEEWEVIRTVRIALH